MNIVFFINIALLIFTISLIAYHVDLKWNPLGRLKCKLGIHRRFRKTYTKRVKTYHCVVCSKTKKHPHLRIVSSEEKDKVI